MFRQLQLFYPFIVSSLLILSACKGADLPVDRSLYDDDGDGLIEINSLADLNEIRNDLTGRSLYGESTGCPEAGCLGFELTQDLDFDTNSDGVLDQKDTYWNEGEGWLPLAYLWVGGDGGFSGVFDGNGYIISNLYANRPDEDLQSLFGLVESGSIRNLGLSGPLGSITGRFAVGAFSGNTTDGTIVSVWADIDIVGEATVGGIVGQSYQSLIKESYSRGDVYATDYSVGGVAGSGDNSVIQACFSTGNISAKRQTVGGLLGAGGGGSKVIASFASGDVAAIGLPELIDYELNGGQVGGLVGTYAEIHGSFSVGAVTGLNQVGGLMGGLSAPAAESNVWAIDASGQTKSNGGRGVNLADIVCPVQPNDENCDDSTLFDGWDQYLNDEGLPYWDFGDENQLPGLRIQGQVFRAEM